MTCLSSTTRAITVVKVHQTNSNRAVEDQSTTPVAMCTLLCVNLMVWFTLTTVMALIVEDKHVIKLLKQNKYNGARYC